MENIQITDHALFFRSTLKSETNSLSVRNFGINSESIQTIPENDIPAQMELFLKQFMVLNKAYETTVSYKFTPHFILDDPEYMKRIVNCVKMHYSGSDELFFQMSFSNLKLITFKQDEQIFTAIHYVKSSSYLIRLYLRFIACVLSNLSFIFNQNEVNSFFLQAVLQRYFLKPITLYFEKTLLSVVKPKNLGYDSMKFKSMYLIDVQSSELLLDLDSLSDEISKKLRKKQPLYQEFCFLAFKLMEAYNRDFGFRADFQEASQRAIRFECSSTYPRLLCIIKFLPIMKGVGVVYVYSVKRISRKTPEQKNSTYREFKVECLNVNIEGETCLSETKLEHPEELFKLEEKICEMFMTSFSQDNSYFSSEPVKYFNHCEIDVIMKSLKKPVKDEAEVTESIDNELVQYYAKPKENPESSITRINSKYFKKELLFDKIIKKEEEDPSFCVPKGEVVFDRNASLSMSKIDSQVNYREIDDYLEEDSEKEQAIKKKKTIDALIEELGDPMLDESRSRRKNTNNEALNTDREQQESNFLGINSVEGNHEQTKFKNISNIEEHSQKLIFNDEFHKLSGKD